MNVAVFFHKFRVTESRNGETLGMGIPLGPDSVLANIDNGNFPAYIHGKAAGTWRIAKELDRDLLNSDLESRSRRWMSGQQLVGVSEFPDHISDPCFICSSQHIDSKHLPLEVKLCEASLQNMTGVLMHYLSLYLCEMYFPGMTDDSFASEFHKLHNYLILEGDAIPIYLSHTGKLGVLVVETAVRDTIRGKFYYVGNTPKIATSERVGMKFSSDFMGTNIQICKILGKVRK